jgi:tetratricopeptide (TPR) repeat protein
MSTTTKLPIKYKAIGAAQPPRPIRIEVDGWGGPSEAKMVDGSNPQPWHCLPFIEGSAYGLELVYPHETECRIVNDKGVVRIEWEFADEPGGGLTGFEFLLFSPVSASKYYLFNTRVDIQAPPGHVLRTEPHPRFFTDETGTCPLAMIGHLQAEWYPRLTFVVFRAPRPGERHVFRKGEPFAQILFVPRQVGYELTEMTDDEYARRQTLERAIQNARLEIAENVWRHPDNVQFNNHYKVLARAFAKEGLTGVEREVSGALARLEAGLPADKSVAEYLELGGKSFAADDFEDAYRLFAKAHALEPDNAEVLTNLGICFACFGGMDKAQELMQAAATIDPRNARYRWNLGELLRRIGRLDEAEASIRAALQLGGDSAAILSVLALILVQQGRKEEGLDAYRAAAANGIPAEAHLRIGSVLAQQRHSVEARACFEAALAIDPRCAPARKALAALAALGPIE